MPPNAATFVQAAMNAVTGVGAPWYTSGVQVWNGPTEPLNSRPTTSRPRPANSSVSDRSDPAAAAAMSRELHRTRVAVQQRQAVEEERRGERAEQEVLDRRFLRQQAATPGETAHQVQRQGKHLERDEHGQQVVRRAERHHAAEGEQRQREHLGLHRPSPSAPGPARVPGRTAACGDEARRPAPRRGPRSAAPRRRPAPAACPRGTAPACPPRCAAERLHAARRRASPANTISRQPAAAIASTRQHDLRRRAGCTSAGTPRPARRRRPRRR